MPRDSVCHLSAISSRNAALLSSWFSIDPDTLDCLVAELPLVFHLSRIGGSHLGYAELGSVSGMNRVASPPQIQTGATVNSEDIAEHTFASNLTRNADGSCVAAMSVRMHPPDRRGHTERQRRWCLARA
jgi:hypothetical protein